jgi:hypothetical protein
MIIIKRLFCGYALKDVALLFHRAQDDVATVTIVTHTRTLAFLIPIEIQKKNLRVALLSRVSFLFVKWLTMQDRISSVLNHGASKVISRVLQAFITQNILFHSNQFLLAPFGQLVATQLRQAGAVLQPLTDASLIPSLFLPHDSLALRFLVDCGSRCVSALKVASMAFELT